MSPGRRQACTRLAHVAALVLLAPLAACAARGPDIARLERQVRDLQDQVYLLEKSRQEVEERLRRLEGARPDEQSALSPPAAPPPPILAGRESFEPIEDIDPVDPVEPVAPVEPLPRVEPAGTRRSAAADAAWSAARQAFDRQRFTEAVALFADFAAGFPADERASEARYLIGESCYAEANFPQAIVEFGKVVDGDPGSRWAADALYKVALSYYELRFEENALEALERLRSAYPDSAAEALARPLYDRLRRRR